MIAFNVHSGCELDLILNKFRGKKIKFVDVDDLYIHRNYLGSLLPGVLVCDETEEDVTIMIISYEEMVFQFDSNENDGW